MANPEILTVVEITHRVWFSPMSCHFGHRYDFVSAQIIDGKSHGISDLKARSHRSFDALRRQRITIKVLPGCPRTSFA
jgi:hypothetical protein